MSDENQISEIDPNVVEQELRAMKPEVFEKVAAMVGKHAQQRQDDTAKLGAMTTNEFNSFVRRKYGYNPG